MFPTINRIATGFSHDDISEIKARIESVEEFSQRLSLQCRILECNIERVEKRGRFLVKWLFALSDCSDQQRQSIEEIKSDLLIKQDQINNLISEFKNLKLG